jgi:hypothetical protein
MPLRFAPLPFPIAHDNFVAAFCESTRATPRFIAPSDNTFTRNGALFGDFACPKRLRRTDFAVGSVEPELYGPLAVIDFVQRFR